ncbi:hypothetical protein MESS2_300050 [Mesorhizobium metallidurans STM 2683]|uniref:Uncharacterized protein n=1 Tax=Mesorhizobium metallidurans STM 2683 TaxID=1297569 RepID=M5EPT2_9HYPH|nr:hypothetical protein MESS2_300050 [Mesorhizobium metallidurans STM 2683]
MSSGTRDKPLRLFAWAPGELPWKSVSAGVSKLPLIKIVAVPGCCHDFAARLTFHLLSQTVR